jgi:hypothetical protein
MVDAFTYLPIVGYSYTASSVFDWFSSAICLDFRNCVYSSSDPKSEPNSTCAGSSVFEGSGF